MPRNAVIAIHGPDDPRIADYRCVRERDLAGRGGLFMGEGLVVLEKLIASRHHRLRSVLVAENKLDSALPRLLGIAAETQVYAASQSVMDAIVGFPIHRGVLGVGERRNLSLEAILAGLPPRALVLVLAGIANHDNMGGLFRNAAAFGVDAVLLDETCCDPLYRKAIRVSVGASLILPFARGESALALCARLQADGFQTIALAPRAAETLAEVTGSPREALIVGAEGSGLAGDVLRAARSVSIPMANDFDSLNVAVAAAIALHHLAGGRTPHA